MTLAERRKWDLRQRAMAFSDELERWKSRPHDPANTTFRKHNCQILAFDQALAKARQGVDGVLADPAFSPEDARECSKVLLGAYRIWEFLRAKLQQRSQDEFLPFLALADEYAWYCYRPVYEQGFKEPPLVYLNGGYSPFILTRHKQFQAEVVPRELIVDRTLQDAMASLPFPVIGVPWYQISSLADLTVLAHEVGHSVEADLKLTVVLDNALNSMDDPMWLPWRSELFADLYACACAGPAFTSALGEFLSAENQAVVHSSYPLPGVRFAFNLRVLELQGHDVNPLRTVYQRIYSNDPEGLFPGARVAAEKMFSAVGTAIGIQFDASMDAYARSLAKSVVIDKFQINSYHSLPILAAAYRYGFNLALSRGGDAMDRLGLINDSMSGLVKADWRNGEVARPEPDFSQMGDLWQQQLEKEDPV